MASGSGKKKGSGGPERARGASSGPPEDKSADKGRFSSKRKMDAALRLLRGEDLETLSRELGVTAAKLSEWRDTFLAHGQAGLKSRPNDGRDDEIARLKEKVADLTLDNELLNEKIDRMEQGRPFVERRSKP